MNLGKVLGYSPMQLGVRATLGWSQCSEVRDALGLDEESKEAPEGEEEPERRKTTSYLKES